MVNWYEFAWAALFYGALGGDVTYKLLMQNEELLSKLRTQPELLSIHEIREQIIEGFLNKWGCRTTNTDNSAKILKMNTIKIIPYITFIKNENILNLNFNQKYRYDNKDIKTSDIIEKCYSILRHNCIKFGPTTTSKFLHIVHPEIFVMLDGKILNHYRTTKKASDSGKGYRIYLENMQKMACNISNQYDNIKLTPPKHKNEKINEYLSRNLNFQPEKSLAKYIDEYNWVTITKNAIVPPIWHP